MVEVEAGAQGERLGGERPVTPPEQSGEALLGAQRLGAAALRRRGTGSRRPPPSGRPRPARRAPSRAAPPAPARGGPRGQRVRAGDRWAWSARLSTRDAPATTRRPVAPRAGSQPSAEPRRRGAEARSPSRAPSARARARLGLGRPRPAAGSRRRSRRAERPQHQHVAGLGARAVAHDVAAVRGPSSRGTRTGRRRRGAAALAHREGEPSCPAAGLDGVLRRPVGTTGFSIWPSRSISLTHWSGLSTESYCCAELGAVAEERPEADVDVVGVVAQRPGVVVDARVGHQRDDLVGLHRALERQQPSDRCVGDRARALVAGDRDAVDLAMSTASPVVCSETLPPLVDVVAVAALQRETVGLQAGAARNSSVASTRRSIWPVWMSLAPALVDLDARVGEHALLRAPPCSSAGSGRSSGSWRRGPRTGSCPWRGRSRSPRAASSRRGSASGRSAGRRCRRGGSRS